MNVETTATALLTTVMQDPLIAGLTGLSVILLIITISLTLRLNAFVRGANGKSLEGTIKTITERVNALESYARGNQKKVTDMDRRLVRAIQGVAVERFDPFKSAGGQQSFATALLNEEGTGIVVSGIHSRDQVRVYAKPVTKFTSERELSEEETKTISQAKQELDK